MQLGESGLLQGLGDFVPGRPERLCVTGIAEDPPPDIGTSTQSLVISLKRAPGRCGTGGPARGEGLPVTGPGSTGRDLLQLLQVLRGQFDGRGCGVLLESRSPPGTGDRNDIITLGEQPSQHELCGGHAAGRGQPAHLVHDCLVAR